MSELQISLMAVGAAVVAGVYAFNRFQERRYKRQTEELFDKGRDDVLLQEPRMAPEQLDSPPVAGVDERIEPRVVIPVNVEMDEPSPAVEVAVVERAKAPQPAPTRSPVTEGLDYVAELGVADGVTSHALGKALPVARFEKPVSWLGLNPGANEWEPLDETGRETYTKIIAAIQLADRNGPLSAAGLDAFAAALQTAADSLGGGVHLPDPQAALATAADLDKFCASVDVQVGINLVSGSGEPFAGTKVRALAEAGGMKLQADGAFHYVNDDGVELFSLSNMDGQPFSPETIRTTTTFGLTLLFDVPRAPGVRAYDQLLMLARQMASTLNGKLVDDNRRPLSDAGIDKIKLQLKDIYARMDARRIRAGSPQALRLFA